MLTIKKQLMLDVTVAKYYIPSGRCIQALDYSSRNEDGSVGKVPDSLMTAFQTKNGREVFEASEDFGGQNLSKVISAATTEMWHSANMSFSLCHLLSQGQIHALEAFGNSEQKLTYLPNLINGSWTGTMNLTEPHAGTDLGSLKSTAISRKWRSLSH